MSAPRQLRVTPEGELDGAACDRTRYGWTVEAGAAVALAVPGRADRFYRHGWHSFSMTRWLEADAPAAPVLAPALRIGGDDPAHALSERPGGSALGAVSLGADDRVLLLGALGLGAHVEWTGGTLAGAGEDPATSWYVGLGTELDVFGEYAELLGARLGSRSGNAPRVWMTWYSLFDDIDPGRVREIVADLRGLDFDCLVVDDGWERAIGDWLPNHRFAGEMDALAGHVAAAGLTPGLWLAPFAALRDSPIARAHPDWFCADETGEPAAAGYGWGSAYLGLDLTHPAALAHLRETIERVVGWGYEYLKLDFLFAGAIPGRRHAETPREHAYRSGIQAIRDAAGDDVFLLGSGAPIIASLGVLDAIRIGPDAAPWWDNALAPHLNVHSEPAAHEAVATSAHRLWLAPLIGTDPDVVYFRSRRQLLGREHQRALQDLARVCESRATSDPPAWLDDGERDALRAFLDETPQVIRRGPRRFEIDGRDVDFDAVV